MIVDKPKVCSVEACGRTDKICRGMCQMHYNRMWKNGQVDLAPKLPTGWGECNKDGCSNERKPHRKLCAEHTYKFGAPRGEPSDWLPNCTRSTEGAGGYVRLIYKNAAGITQQPKEHRVVMEITLGRELMAEENVHHMNGNRSDNRPENLELWNTSQPAGQRIEDKLKWAHELIQKYEVELGYANNQDA